MKRLLEQLLERFGKEVLRHADKSLHPMNLKHTKRIENRKLACELELEPEEKEREADEGAKRQRRKGPARMANVGDWAQEASAIAETGWPLGGRSVAIMETRVATVTENWAR